MSGGGGVVRRAFHPTAVRTRRTTADHYNIMQSFGERTRTRGMGARILGGRRARARDIGPLLRGASSAVDDPPRRDDATAASVGGAAEGRSDPPPALVRNGCAGPRGSAFAIVPGVPPCHFLEHTHGQSAPSSEEGHNLNIGVDYNMPFESNCIIHFFGW